MACWCGVDGHFIQRQALPPIQFDHPFGGVMAEPAFEAQRYNEGGIAKAFGQFPDGLTIQMVVVIMGNQHHIYRRQLFYR
ncbi:hypothetical protein D3C75_1030460 [compost metagenome]